MRLRNKDAAVVNKKMVSGWPCLGCFLWGRGFSVSSVLLPPPSSSAQRKRQEAINEGWEYARLANLTYHLTEHRLDFARRKRWIRKLVACDAGRPPIFRFPGKKEKVRPRGGRSRC